ncbi:HAMP domain-containing methyl-accepting chemotaxis protein [Niveibacterium umoris]|uniref:Methyl-accepting chemotaxis protein n=1 Tax=Niveibacterium umoris TaxID=1193620 RepID=A0A840BRE8_9RHOO|nr:methyl-accepting chemotaxis protein [Niveibacterium umoris]MBB4014252.1 methyl-accepting chemotaxis protein [Niveibacterium umoris]
MKAVFRPAIALMNRLSFPKKYVVMGTMTSLAILILLVHLFQALYGEVRDTRNELQGLAYLQDTQKLIRALQIHRGASTAVLSGNKALEDTRAGKEKEILELLARVDQGLAATQMGKGESWQGIKGKWEQIRSGWSQSQPPDNLVAHTALLADALVFQVAVADEFGLTLDPEADSYYLIDVVVNKLPIVLESLGQSRARGTAILTKKEINETQKIEFGALLAQIDGQIRLSRLAIDKASRGSAKEKLAGVTEELATSIKAVTDLVRQDILTGSFATDPKAYFDLTTKTIDGGYDKMFTVMMPSIAALLEDRVARNMRTIVLDFGSVFVLLALAMWFWLGAYFAIVEQITDFSKGAHRMAGGDLTTRIADRTRDEMSQLVRSFNDMADSFASLIRKTRESADRVTQASQEMARSSSEISVASQQEADAASSMAASVEQMTVGITHISTSAEEAGSVATEAGHLSKEGEAVVVRLVSEVRGVADAVNQASAVVEELGRHSDEISKIVGVIKEVADQTNLLALNAAIEAARAGEQGRGFAVVADEVRKLAERTAKSTQEITAMIEIIQRGTRSAVDSMKTGVERVEQGVGLTEEAGASMQAIQRGSEKVTDAVTDISSALREQSAAATELAQRVEQIAQMAEETSASVADNAGTARHLEQLAEGLQDEMRHFKL